MSDYGKNYLKRLSSEYEKRRAVHNIQKYEKAYDGMDLIFGEEDKRGLSTLDFSFSTGNPDDYSSWVDVCKDAKVWELEAFPGVYWYQEYCLNNLVVQGALQQMKLLYDFGTSKDTHFVEMSTFQVTLETFYNNWH